MTPEQRKKATNELVTHVMRVQKIFAHEQIGAKNDRRNEIKKIINRIASEIEGRNAN